MTKSQIAALGFRVKSGWAAVVLLGGTARSAHLADVGRVDLCDAQLPETRQPYHAGTGELESDEAILHTRERVVRNISQESLTKLLTGYQERGFWVKSAALVVGSQIDPAKISNPHIRAHALEGRLFRSAVVDILNDRKIRTDVLLERDAYSPVAARLKQSSDDLKQVIQNLRRSAPVKDESWRAEQKLAAVAALFALG